MLRTPFRQFSSKVAIPSVNWDAYAAKATTADAQRALAALRNRLNEASGLHNKWVREPESIDFKGYKSRVRFVGSAVDAIETQYKNTKLPQSTFEITAEEDGNRNKLKSVVVDTVDAAKQELESLRKELKMWEENSITLETNTEEMLQRHPQLAREIEQEINDHQWTKDT